MNHDNYENNSKKIRAENKKLLEEFAAGLKSLGMKKADTKRNTCQFDQKKEEQ